MTTMGDVLTAAEGGAAGVNGSDFPKTERETGQITPPFVTPAPQSTTTVRNPLRVFTQMWVWTDTPPSLQQVIASRTPERVPGDATQLRVGWTVWNTIVAVPATAVLYAVAWMLQHPARAACLMLVAGPIGFFWITG